MPPGAWGAGGGRRPRVGLLTVGSGAYARFVRNNTLSAEVGALRAPRPPAWRDPGGTAPPGSPAAAAGGSPHPRPPPHASASPPMRVSVFVRASGLHAGGGGGTTPLRAHPAPPLPAAPVLSPRGFAALVATGLQRACNGPATGLQRACNGPATGLQRACNGPATGLQRACNGPATAARGQVFTDSVAAVEAALADSDAWREVPPAPAPYAACPISTG